MRSAEKQTQTRAYRAGPRSQEEAPCGPTSGATARPGPRLRPPRRRHWSSIQLSYSVPASASVKRHSDSDLASPGAISTGKRADC